MTPILQLLDDFGSAFLKASDGKHAPLYGRTSIILWYRSTPSCSSSKSTVIGRS